MTEATPTDATRAGHGPLAYAADDGGREGRRLRLTLGAAAVAYAGSSMLRHFIHIGQAYGWLPGRSGFTFDPRLAMDWIEILTLNGGEIVLLLGGVLLIARVRASTWLVRIGAVSMAFCYAALSIRNVVIYAGMSDARWLRVVEEAASLASGITPPFLLAALTFARLRRQMFEGA